MNDTHWIEAYREGVSETWDGMSPYEWHNEGHLIWDSRQDQMNCLLGAVLEEERFRRMNGGTPSDTPTALKRRSFIKGVSDVIVHKLAILDFTEHVESGGTAYVPLGDH